MARSIFEEVGDKDSAEAGKRAPAGGGGSAEREARGRKAVRIWLYVLAAMVIAQILVGALTRLTDSGLSITEWRPVTGAVPPLSESDWASEFSKYQGTTEFQEQNADMTMAEFQTIYWWEWGHRLWGRIIGLVFFIGFAALAYRRAIPIGWMGRILLIGGLGALQGLIGWWMVASGLVGRLDVSQHRLAVHLGLAFLILGLILWTALGLKGEAWQALQARRRREPRMPGLAAGLTILIFLQIIMGAYVAGLDAGRVYAEWPTMGGALYPPGEPFAPFTEQSASQWLHRMLGYLVFVAALVFALLSRKSAFAKTRLWGWIVLGVTFFQIVLGVHAVLYSVPLWLGLAHQAGAILLFGAVVHAWRQNAYPAEEKIAG